MNVYIMNIQSYAAELEVHPFLIHFGVTKVLTIFWAFLFPYLEK